MHTQLHGTCELYQFGTNTTPHPRLECFHSIDSCSTQPHETWVISHDYTETHSPIKPGLGSLFFNSSPNPKHAPEFARADRWEGRDGNRSSGESSLPNVGRLPGIRSLRSKSGDLLTGMGTGAEYGSHERGPLVWQYCRSAPSQAAGSWYGYPIKKNGANPKVRPVNPNHRTQGRTNLNSKRMNLSGS